MTEDCGELRLFSTANLEVIRSHPVLFGGAERDVIQLRDAWAAHVRKIDADRALPYEDHTVWNEHDLCAALIIRDCLQLAIDGLPAEVASKATEYAATVDESFRSYTVADSGRRMAAVAEMGLRDRGWWWFRVPDSGPIVQDLARWDKFERRRGTRVAMSEVTGRSVCDVRCWPHDVRARRALEEYFGQPVTGPHGVQMLEVPLEARGLDFSGADLSELDLDCAIFFEAGLADVRMIDATLDHAWLIRTDLTRADLSSASLVKTQGRHCRAPYAKLHGADVQKSDFDHADLLGAELDGARLRLTSFAEADLRYASLRSCRLHWAGFEKARMADCDVAEAAGTLLGPIDVGVDSLHLLDGQELQEWFAARGAPEIEVLQRVRSR